MQVCFKLSPLFAFIFFYVHFSGVKVFVDGGGCMCLVGATNCLVVKLRINSLIMGLWTIEVSTILALTTCKWMFHKHLEVIKVAYYQPKNVCTNVWVLEVLSTFVLDIQQSMFKLAMKSNTLDAMAKPTCLNPLTLFWCTLSTNIMFSCFSLSISNWQK